ncbi:hypothetical protein DC74_4476 [Streptomyces noursei]|nr:hypothetical protein DC74_4476 [Streptomyces noursei]
MRSWSERSGDPLVRGRATRAGRAAEKARRLSAGGGILKVMTTLKAKLKDDLTAAIKARDELRSATLRLTLTALQKEEVAGTEARELSDGEVEKIVAREAKKRREAAEAFDKGGRAEQAERERAEGEVLAEYLPKPLTDDELESLVAAAVAEATGAGAEGPKAMGAVMKIVNPKVAGRADGGRVAAMVKKLLAG